MANGNSALLYNIVVVVAEELDPDTYLPYPDGIYHRMNCARTATINPLYSSGDETVVRQDMIILDDFRTPDLLYGYQITLEDTYLNDEFLQLIEGGTRPYNQYRMPRLEDGFVSKPFRLTLWVENYDGASVVNYIMLRYNFCYGRLDTTTLGGNFYMPQFLIEAREPTMVAGLPIRDVFYTTYLPDDPDADIPRRYGFRIDKNNPDPEARIDYLYDAQGHVPAGMIYNNPNGKSKNMINNEWHRTGSNTSYGITCTPSHQGACYTFSGQLTDANNPYASIYLGNVNNSSATSFRDYLKSQGLWEVGKTFTISIDKELSSLTLNGSVIDIKNYTISSRRNAYGTQANFTIGVSYNSEFIGTTGMTLSTVMITQEMIDYDVTITPRLLIYGEYLDLMEGTFYIQIEEGAFNGLAMYERYSQSKPQYDGNNIASFATIDVSGYAGSGWQSPNNTSTFSYGSWETTFFVKNNRPVMVLPDGTIDYELSRANQYYRSGDFSREIILTNNDFEIGAYGPGSGAPSNDTKQQFLRTKSTNELITVNPGEQLHVKANYNDIPNAFYVRLYFYEGTSYRGYADVQHKYATKVIGIPTNVNGIRIILVNNVTGGVLDVNELQDVTITVLPDRLSDIYNITYTGNAMSEFPQVWMHQYEDENYEYCIVSNVQFDENYTCWSHQNRLGNIMDTTYIGMFEAGNLLLTSNTLASLYRNVRRSTTYGNFMTYASRIGTGWHIMSNAKFNMLKMLTLLIGKSDNSQDKFGIGITTASDVTPVAGLGISWGQFFGSNSVTNTDPNARIPAKLFYVENVWGNYYQGMVGLRLNLGIWQKIQGNYLYNSNFDDIGPMNEYYPTESTIYPSQTKMIDGARIPMNATGGSTTTYTSDAAYGLVDFTAHPWCFYALSRTASTIKGINNIYSHSGANSSNITTRIIFDKDE